jgi:histidine kinase 2/3/4 (cytokinin receptor)
MLDLSKIEAGTMEVESVPFDIREELDNILSLFEEKFQQKNLEVAALIHDRVPPWLYGDPGRLHQVSEAVFCVPMVCLLY